MNWQVTRLCKVALVLAAGLFSTCSAVGRAADVDGARLVQAASEPENWLAVSGGYDEKRFSPLTQINAASVKSLGLAWSYDIPTHLGQEASPVVVDGVMYVSTDGDVVKAFDAKTGRTLWSYDPGALSQLVRSCCGPNNRGVAVWKGRVYIGTLDGRLIALDAASGKPDWSVLTINPVKPYSISGAPRIVNDKVIIGNGGAELGVRGYVSAYDAVKGTLVWRFYTVPGDPRRRDHASSDAVLAKIARPTWSGRYWELGGGGTVWDSMAYDPKLNLLYIGVGNGGPWNEARRSPGGGDNLFLSSIVALNADTGKYVWHYQTTPGDSWDFTATQSIILADLRIGGTVRKVLMQAPKNGFFYVLDRKTGRLLSAQPFAPVTWAKGIDLRNGRPIENPDARYYKSTKSFLMMPGSAGAHNWQPMAFSSKTGLAYIPVQNIPQVFVPETNAIFGPKTTNVAVVVDGATPISSAQLYQAHAAIRGWLAAWDPIQQREIWRVPQKHFWNGGVLVTSGNVVFQGNGAAEFVAYEARTGKRLWSFDAQSAIIAAPVTYAVGGQQYVAVLTGWGGIMPMIGGGVSDITGRENGPNRILVFKLGGTQRLPDFVPFKHGPIPNIVLPLPPASPVRGAAMYSRYCFRCHGEAAVSGGVTPDLRYSGYISRKDDFAGVVLGGALAKGGMASFADQLTPKGAEDVRAYLVERAQQARTQDR